jgi:hypothetical protein
MRRTALAICLLSATACLSNGPSSPSPVDRQVVLAPGEAAVASGLNVRFLRVLEDSRCPADALCVWIGDAVVRIDISAGQDQAERDLHTANKQPVSFNGSRIELVALAPYPYSSGPIRPEDYRATLRIRSEP